MNNPENEYETDAQNISMSQRAKTLCVCWAPIMTGTTVISPELAMVTLLRQPAELPPVHKRQQSAVCESCQGYKYSF